MPKMQRQTQMPGKNSPPARVIPLFSGSAATLRPAGEGVDDATLLAGIVSGDHAAFAALVRRHTVRFYRLAYRFTGRRAEAEDIVQDAFLKLWERPGMWQPDKQAAFTTWFYRIIVNLCLDQAKKKRPLPLENDGEHIEDEREAKEEEMIAREKERLLETQIALLPDRQRAALNLCFYEGLSNQEAATAMGVHLKALQSLLMRAKTTLKERLKFMISE